MSEQEQQGQPVDPTNPQTDTPAEQQPAVAPGQAPAGTEPAQSPNVSPEQGANAPDAGAED